MATLVKVTNHLFEWLMLPTSRRVPHHTRASMPRCANFVVCLKPNSTLMWPALIPPPIETRRTCRRAIGEFFLCYRHQHFLQGDKWITPLLDHMETNIWLDTTASGDLWNGRWTEETLRTLLQNYAETPVSQRDFK
jgi:hypothetical protein